MNMQALVSVYHLPTLRSHALDHVHPTQEYIAQVMYEFLNFLLQIY